MEYHNNVMAILCLAGPSSNSTTITWKEGKDLLKLLQFKQHTNRRKRHLEYKTFFDWFVDNTDPVNDEIAEVCIFVFFLLTIVTVF